MSDGVYSELRVFVHIACGYDVPPKVYVSSSQLDAYTLGGGSYPHVPPRSMIGLW